MYIIPENRTIFFIPGIYNNTLYNNVILSPVNISIYINQTKFLLFLIDIHYYIFYLNILKTRADVIEFISICLRDVFL